MLSKQLSGRVMFRRNALKTAKVRLLRFKEYRDEDGFVNTASILLFKSLYEMMSNTGLQNIKTIQEVADRLPEFQSKVSRSALLDFQGMISRAIDKLHKQGARHEEVTMMYLDGLFSVFRYHPSTHLDGKKIKSKDHVPEELLMGYTFELGKLLDALGENVKNRVDYAH